MEPYSGATEEVLRARLAADIIVDPEADLEVPGDLGARTVSGLQERTVRTVTGLQEALGLARDGDKIFLEAGRYTRPEGWSLTSRVSLSGAGAGQVIIPYPVS